MEIFKWIMMHPDVTVIISFEDDRYIRLRMSMGLLNRVRVFTPDELRVMSVDYILGLTYQELCEECRKWRIGDEHV